MSEPISDSGQASVPPRLVRVGEIQWPQVLEFTHLFKAFRLAINPAKIVVGLLAIVLIYVSGCLFDWAWGPQVIGDELGQYLTLTPESYHRLHEARRKDRTDDLARLLDDALSGTDDHMTIDDRLRLAESPRAAFGVLRRAYENDFHKTVEDLRKDAAETHTEWAGIPDTKTAKERELEGRAAAAKRLQNQIIQARLAAGVGIFESVSDFELAQFDMLVDNTLAVIRIAPAHSIGIESDLDRANENALSTGVISKEPNRFWRSDTIAGCLANMTITAPCWLFSSAGPMQWEPDNVNTKSGWAKMWAYRLLYLLSVTLLAAVWFVLFALAGAIICRLSALEFAGNDKASLMQIFRFALKKMFNFIKAPLMPFVILFIIGILLSVAALVGAIPFLGEILVGLVFILFLAVGFVMMLLLLGIIGGMQLLYPTIAIEGSDSFDAMSRSFAYVYARPWRLVFYTLISLVYGAITFLFVTFAVYLILGLTHFFAGWGMGVVGYVHGWYSGAEKLDTLWPAPRFGHLWAPVNWSAMNWSEYGGAMMLHLWLALLLFSVAAYVLSFYFSSNTIIYFLLRRSVDGQSLTEVYEQSEEEVVKTPAAVIAAAEAASAVPPPASPASQSPGDLL